MDERNGLINEVKRLFHELWTKEVGTPGYDRKNRKKWMDLQRALNELGVPV
jgi:hypothetical protein